MNQTVIKSAFMALQDRICSDLEILDVEGKFKEDAWERPGGGGGKTRIIIGKTIEKGGVNFSAVEGHMPEKISTALGLEKTQFFATGVSIVLHAKNPFIPIIHMNVRYFETTHGTWWFGGGIDLTPHYIDEELASSFHQQLKNVCDKHASHYYSEFKKWADDYFYIKHRKETRGVGGIFFDRLDKTKGTKEDLFNFVMDVGNLFSTLYKEQVDANRDKAFSPINKDWQLHRRGRYVEFNLVWDRGTKFGLDTDGNIESILMSLPPESRWTYKHDFDEEEEKTLNLLKKDIDWVNRKAR